MTARLLTPPATGALILERLPEVLARTGHKRSEWYRQIASGKAPRPVKLGERASAWVASEVDAYIARRIAERDARAAT